jgi:hypothetical protein
MFRIDGPGATQDNKFREGDPATGTRATVVSAEWLNAVQEEIAHVIEREGLEVSKLDSQQLAKALDKISLRYQIDSIAEGIAGRTVMEGQQLSVTGWHPGSAVGGSTVTARASVAKSEHGIAGWSPTVPKVSEQSGATLAERTANYLSGAGETDPAGSGLFVFDPNQSIDSAKFGAVADGSDQKPIFDFLNTSGRTVDLKGNTYTYAGIFTPAATFYNGKIVATNRAFDFTERTNESPARVIQGRARIDYGSANSVKVFVPESIVLAGFRFLGCYRKPGGRAIATGVNGSLLVNDNSDLSILNTRKLENWYAVFAGANQSDVVASFVNVPFFRAFSVVGNEITLGEGKETTGENHIASAYDMAIDVMVGSEVLIIQENGIWSGRTTSVTANTSSTITVADASGVQPGDFFLVAPPEFAEYCYLGGWYLDTSSPRNRADTGSHVGALHFQIPDLVESGELAKTEFSVRGMVCPLATAYVAKLSYVVNTTATGKVVHSVDHDGNDHRTMTVQEMKYGSLAHSPTHQTTILPFSKKQSLWIACFGDLAASVTSRQFQCYGWIEP